MNPRWYVKTTSGEIGPVSTNQLNRWIRSKNVNPDSLVRRGDGGWRKAKYFFGLVFDQHLARWFIKSKHNAFGPVSLQRLGQLVENCVILPETGVTLDGKRWLSAERVPGIRFESPALPRWLVSDQTSERKSLDELRDLARSGQLSPNDRVSQDAKHWFSARRIAGLEFSSQEEDQSNLPSNDDNESLYEAIDDETLDAADNAHTQVVDEGLLDRIDAESNAPDSADQQRIERQRAEQNNLEDDRDEPEAEVPQVDANENLDTEDDVETIKKPAVVYQSVPFKDRYREQVILATAGQIRENKRCGRPCSSSWQRARIDDSTHQQEAPSNTSQATPPASPDGDQSSRLNLFRKHFGNDLTIHRPPSSNPSTIFDFDIIEHHPTPQRPFTTLISCGLSDIEMSLPSGRDVPSLQSSRVELMVYLEASQPRYIQLLRFLGESIFRCGQWIGYGMVVGNGSPPAPIFAGSQLSSFVFLVPLIGEDFALKDSLIINDENVQPLWVVPVTAAERRMIESQGVAAFCKLAEDRAASPILMPNRRCYLQGHRQFQPLEKPDVW